MKRLISLLLTVLIIAAQVVIPVPYFAVSSVAADNKCGDNITWYVDTQSGVLTLEGTGKTYEYDVGSAPWDKYYSYITSVTVGEGITYLMEGTFDKLYNVRTLTLPSTIEEIHTHASMISLENIIFPEQTELQYVYSTFAARSPWYVNQPDGSLIYYGSFLYGVKGNLSDDVTSIEIRSGTTAIGRYAFSYQTSLSDIVFPDSLKYIGENAFENTAWLDNQPDGLIYAAKVLVGCKGDLPSVNCVLRGDTVAIADNAFYYNQDIKSIVIPSSVIQIGKNAFWSCRALTEVTFEENCLLKVINAAAFYQTGLKDISIPESVEKIGKSAFSLTDIEYVFIPASVINCDGAFAGMVAVRFIEVSPENSNYWSNSSGVVFSKDKTVLHFFPSGNKFTDYTVPDGTKHLADACFSYTDLNKITFNDDLETAGDRLFTGSYKLTKIDFGSGLSVIHSDLLAGNSPNYKELIIPENIKLIGQYAFSARSITDLYFFTTDAVIQYPCMPFADKVTFHCYSGSTAHQYAVENGVQYVLLDDELFTLSLEEALLKAEGVYRDNYSADSLALLDAAVAAVDLNKEGLTQQQIDEWCKAIESALDSLEARQADYSELKQVIKNVKEINRSLYTLESLSRLDRAVNQVEEGLSFEKQDVVDNWKAEIEKAVNSLEYLPADYSEVEKAIQAANALDRRYYSDYSLVLLDNSISSVEYGYDVSKQAQVDGFAQAIKTAIENLKFAAVVLRHTACGVIVSATTKEIKPDTKLSVETVDPSNYEGTNFAVGGSIRSLHFYDIKLIYQNSSVQPDGTVTVKIKLADGVDPTKCKVYHVTDDIVNPLVRFASTIDGNYITFETDHFSEFAIIEVEPTVTSIEIQSLPAKTEYNIADTLDLTGLVVTAYYSDSSVKQINDYSVSMTDMSSLGTKKVKLFYTFGGVTKTAEFEITVTDSACSADIFYNSVSAERVNKKLGLFQLYSKAFVQLECFAENVGEGTVHWRSDNPKVIVDSNGKVTCKGLFGAKSANITVEVFDSEGNVIASDTVKVSFYKLSFQLSRFTSAILSKAVNALIF